MPGSSVKTIEHDVAVMYDRLRNGKQDMQLYVTCRCKVIKAALGCGWTPEMEARIKALDEASLVRDMENMWAEPKAPSTSKGFFELVGGANTFADKQKN
jgi:hypothetical protein